MTHDLAHAMHQFRRWFRRNNLPLDGIEVIVRFPSDRAWHHAVGALAVELMRLSREGFAPSPAEVAEGSLYGVKFRFTQDSGDGALPAMREAALLANESWVHPQSVVAEDKGADYVRGWNAACSCVARMLYARAQSIALGVEIADLQK
jgi:hypothetical protein